MRRTHSLIAVLVILAFSVVFAACGDDEEPASSGSSSSEEASGNQIQKVDGADATTVTVGSKNFTEQFVLGEIYAQTLEAAGFKVKRDFNLGSEVVAYAALKADKIDAYPEYTGTSLTAFFDVKPVDVPRDPQKAYEDTKAGMAKDDITALAPTPFENTYRLGMTKEGAAKIGDPKTISELKGKEGDLAISGFPECKQRKDCLLGLQDTYGLKFGKFVASEQKYQVLKSGDADVAFIFTTDGDLASGEYVVLDDDKKFYPPYNITFNVRNEVMEKIGPEGQKAIEAVQKPLTDKVMQELNARVDVDKQKPADAARDYLQKAGFTK